MSHLMDMIASLQTSMNTRFDAFDGRFEALDGKVSNIQERLDTLDQKMTDTQERNDTSFTGAADRAVTRTRAGLYSFLAGYGDAQTRKKIFKKYYTGMVYPYPTLDPGGSSLGPKFYTPEGMGPGLGPSLTIRVRVRVWGYPEENFQRHQKLYQEYLDFSRIVYKKKKKII
ncbi:hypothetical protein M9H77_34921 [Catharanthus roseus]|uniref:Uncharacterized protein n=1 Tax=Catharanthus roseus TaxID=4058 RepID=A0ACB9ZNT6_CATRO|nr:hypothetical protein M9H77_34921 [Catharanthus roseus]